MAGSSRPMRGSATLTIVPSRNTAPDPMTVATRVHRWRGVIARSVADRLSALCPDPWRSSAPASSSRRWPRSMPTCSPRPAWRARAWSILPTASYPRRRGRLPALGGDGRGAFRGSRRGGRAGPRPRSCRRRRPGRRPGRRRGRPRLPVRREAGYLLAALAGSAVGRALAGGPRAGRGAGRLLGRGDGAGRARVRLPGAARAVAAALGAWAGFAAGRLGRAALRRLAGAVLGADRVPGTARLGRPRASTRTRPSSVTTAAWQVHGRRGSRSGAAAAASGSAPGRCSGSRPPSTRGLGIAGPPTVWRSWPVTAARSGSYAGHSGRCRQIRLDRPSAAVASCRAAPSVGRHRRMPRIRLAGTDCRAPGRGRVSRPGTCRRPGTTNAAGRRPERRIAIGDGPQSGRTVRKQSEQ